MSKTSRHYEMVQDSRQDADTFWAETETRPEMHSLETETETLNILSEIETTIVCLEMVSVSQLCL